MPCVLIAVLAALILAVWRALVIRGYDAAIPMDGASFLTAEDGRMAIRRHRIRNWIYLSILASAALGLLALMLFVFRNALQGTRSGGQVLEALAVFLFGGGIVAAALLTLWPSLWRPSIHIDPQAQMLQIGAGLMPRFTGRLAARRIPFLDVTAITVELVREGTFADAPTGVFEIGVLLENRERLDLGTVSGPQAEAESRALTIAHHLSTCMGTATRQPALAEPPPQE
jgi:hypothetical protein